MMQILALLGIAVAMGALMSTREDREDAQRRYIEPLEPWAILGTVLLLAAWWIPELLKRLN